MDAKRDAIIDSVGEIVEEAWSVGLYTTVAWLVCDTPNIWFVYLGWMMGCILVVVFKVWRVR